MGHTDTLQALCETPISHLNTTTFSAQNSTELPAKRSVEATEVQRDVRRRADREVKPDGRQLDRHGESSVRQRANAVADEKNAHVHANGKSAASTSVLPESLRDPHAAVGRAAGLHRGAVESDRSSPYNPNLRAKIDAALDDDEVPEIFTDKVKPKRVKAKPGDIDYNPHAYFYVNFSKFVRFSLEKDTAMADLSLMAEREATIKQTNADKDFNRILFSLSEAALSRRRFALRANIRGNGDTETPGASPTEDPHPRDSRRRSRAR